MKEFYFYNSNGKSGVLPGASELDVLMNLVGREWDELFFEQFDDEYVYFLANGYELTVTSKKL